MRLQWHDIPGWFTTEDARALGRLCDSVCDGGRIVEIGSFLGRSTVCMADRVRGRDIRILAVDNFRGGEPNDPATLAQRQQPTLSALIENLKSAEVDDFVDIMVSDSINAACWGIACEPANCFEPMDCEALVFIDGDHRPEAVMADIDAWHEWVNYHRGILCGHDAAARPGAAARERFKHLYRQEANIWWVENGK